MVLDTPTSVGDTHRTFSILVTDDDPGSRSTLADLLKERGFSPLVASSGEEAIEIAQATTVHLAVFDMHMPRMTGLEALQQVRLFNELLPAILVTADATREVLRQALQAHVFSVIPKPVNKSILFHTLARALMQVYGKDAVEPNETPGATHPPTP
jgi:two-component system, response regulator PdtaR